MIEIEYQSTASSGQSIQVVAANNLVEGLASEGPIPFAAGIALGVSTIVVMTAVLGTPRKVGK